jgi:hypothetical protein
MQRADTVHTTRPSFLAVEIGVVLALVLLCTFTVRPLLEEWALLNAFQTFGLSYISIFSASAPLRPLHLVPAAVNWLLGQGQPAGVTAGTALMFVLRYLAARWAVTPLLGSRERWVVASLAAVLVAWPGAWMGRFGPAQATVVLVFVMLGACIRLHLRWQWRWMLVCVVSAFALLCTYQALALCLLALPLLALLWTPLGRAGAGAPALPMRGALRVAASLMVGTVAYALFAFVVTRNLGNGGYEGELANNSARLLTLRGLSSHIAQAYATSFGNGSQLLPLLLLLAAALLAPAVMAQQQSRRRALLTLLPLALILALPLFSIIYVNEAHIRDIDRVLFPAITGFVLVCISLLAWIRELPGARIGRWMAAVVVAVLMVSALLSALEIRRYALVQRTVLKQTIAAIQERKPGSVLLVDTTGTLGDVYTFLNPTLTDALANRGVRIPASICTPVTIDRLHPVARRFPFEATPRCDQAPPMAAPTLVLTAGWDRGALLLKP